MDPIILEKAKSWLCDSYDQATREEVQYMIDNDHEALIDSFYRDLEFGTGGLRGIMGAGTNRMNKYTVGMSTQGLANYLKMSFPNQDIKIAIAHDSRNNSPEFAEICAQILSANGIYVYLFKGLRPTPELSFTIRRLNCQSGIVITASHNPKEYNGYKVYWEDGAQLINPHDKNVVAEAKKIKDISEVQWEGKAALIRHIGEEIDREYVDMIKGLSLSPEVIGAHKDLKIVYTPLHGTGVDLVPRSLKAIGFENVSVVAEQAVIDGDFPTVVSPNPEEAAALKMALNQCKKEDADLLMGTDPDADRVGIAVKNFEGEYVLLNGNQTGTLLVYYLLTKWKENGKLQGKEYIAKTIVTTELLAKLAAHFEVMNYDVLTGFKFIADLIRNLEGKETFIGGGEESYGYLIGDKVRDKDAVASCCLIAEAAAWAKSMGIGVYGLLAKIYTEHGFFLEHLISITRKGKKGAEEIAAMMENYRNNPPEKIAGSPVVMMKDYDAQISKDLKNGTNTPIDLPRSNVLQFFTEDGSKITMRPSGTEPKIKFYFGVIGELDTIHLFEEKKKELHKRIDAIIEDLGLQ